MNVCVWIDAGMKRSRSARTNGGEGWGRRVGEGGEVQMITSINDDRSSRCMDEQMING